MLPLILPSDRIIVRGTKTIKINDIVVFQRHGRLIAHRVIFKPENENYFITRGDNNPNDDGRVKLRDVLGVVREIVRQGEKIKLDNVYLSQSIAYLREISRLVDKLQLKRINYVILKGFPVHFFVSKALPRRLFIDLDLLVSKKNYKSVQKVMEELGFTELKEGKKSSQATYIKNCEPYYVKVDLHCEAAIGFTRALDVNKIFLGEDRVSEVFLKNTKRVIVNHTSFRILEKDYLLVYLLLHFFHHNFSGAHRMELIAGLVKKQFSLAKVSEIIKSFGFQSLIFPAIGIINKYHPSDKLLALRRTLKIAFYMRVSAGVISRVLNPFSDGTKNMSRIIRFIFIFLFSPIPFVKKIAALFSANVLEAIDRFS